MERTSSRLRTTLRGRGRELAVLCAGLAAGAALLWAGATVHDGLRTAGDVAIARLSGAVADTVVAEWERMLRASEPPVAAAGETFRWKFDDRPRLALNGIRFDVDIESGDRDFLDRNTFSVFGTLLDEAERRELVEHDDPGALELVLEAIGKEVEDDDPEEAWLHAIQIGARLGRMDIVEAQWQHIRASPIERGPWNDGNFVPYRVLGWLALPEEIRATVPASTVLGPEDLERLCSDDDRLALGPVDEPDVHFELAPMVFVLCERMGLPLPPLEGRKFAALARLGQLPQNVGEGRWHLATFGGRPFLMRRDGEEFKAWFYAPRALEIALSEHSACPPGFRLDFEGGREDIGPAVQPRTSLPYSPFAFTLRHVDPQSVARAESSRLKVLRSALVALACACVAGGFLMARVLARQRKLAELKSAFVAGVSHDLRTPLASILLLAENLETGVAGEADRARYHGALRKEATRLRRLVDDVLDFARLERGEAPRLEREEIELARFVDELAEELGARVAEAGRAFTCERGVLPAVAALDAHAVRRALDNLIDNALEHGLGALRLSAASASGRLLLAVADEGPGVPAAHRERVFEPFERLNGANGHAGGTGLGLAIVRSVARAHGGEARVRADERGIGAVFELDLPLEEPPA